MHGKTLLTSQPYVFTSITGHREPAVLRIRNSEQRNNQKSLSTFKQLVVSEHVAVHAGSRGGTTHRNQRGGSVTFIQI